MRVVVITHIFNTYREKCQTTLRIDTNNNSNSNTHSSIAYSMDSVKDTRGNTSVYASQTEKYGVTSIMGYS